MVVRYVAGVSLPRSGHHLVQRLVQRYFGPELVYCDFYPKDRDCCRTFPCTRTNVRFSKNHDFESAAVPVPDVPYLIQYRGVIAAAVSDYELNLHVQTGKPDTPERFEQFATTKARVWGQFVKKWVDTDSGLERCILRYEDLTAEPEKWMSNVVRFFSPSTEIDTDRLRSVINSAQHQMITKSDEIWKNDAGVKQFRRVEEFRFYDRDLFRRIEAVAEDARRK